jgi:hypothetical protein
MKQVAGFPNSIGTRITLLAVVRVQSRGSAAAVTEQISTRTVSIPNPDLASHLAALPTVVGTTTAVFAVAAGRGVSTAIWWGDAGMPAIMSEGLGDCSAT